MKPASSSPRFTLNKDGLIALREAVGRRITCLEGSVWITQEGTIKDEILEAGDTLIVRHSGVTLISALSRASVMVDPSPAPSVRRSVRHWFGLERVLEPVR